MPSCLPAPYYVGVHTIVYNTCAIVVSTTLSTRITTISITALFFLLVIAVIARASTHNKMEQQRNAKRVKYNPKTTKLLPLPLPPPPPPPPAAISYFYAIGTADPGTGSKDGYFFTMPELADVVKSGYMLGTQVWLEHGDASREIIGDVVYTWLDKKSGLMVVLRFDFQTLRSKVLLEWIKSGLFSGISLGYNADVKYIEGLIIVHKKTIVELSIVRDPYHKSCKIGFIGNTIPQVADSPPHTRKQAEEDPWQTVFSCL